MDGDSPRGGHAPDVLVETHALDLRVPGRHLIRDLALRVERGRRLGLTGPSGCGKTTLLRAIVGRRLTDGSAAKTFRVSDERIGYVAQQGVLLPWYSLSRNLSVWSRSAPPDAEAWCNDVLRLVELESASRTFPEHLSGGQKQRARLALAIAPQPALYCADEPLTEVGIQQKWRLLSRWSRYMHEQQSSLILVSHDVDTLLYLCDEVLVLSGAGAEPASVIAAFDIPTGEHPRDVTKLDATIRDRIMACLLAGDRVGREPRLVTA